MGLGAGSLKRFRRHLSAGFYNRLSPFTQRELESVKEEDSVSWLVQVIALAARLQAG
jgi:hypothetical protein